VCLQAEARAEFAERSVQKLQKEVDRLEGEYCLSTKYLLVTLLKYFQSRFLYNDSVVSKQTLSEIRSDKIMTL